MEHIVWMSIYDETNSNGKNWTRSCYSLSISIGVFTEGPKLHKGKNTFIIPLQQDTSKIPEFYTFEALLSAAVNISRAAVD